MTWIKPFSRVGAASIMLPDPVYNGSMPAPAVPAVREKLTLRHALGSDLAEIAQIEAAAYAFPWTEGNFADALGAGYDFWIVESHGAAFGYALVMWLPDEAHLLNITIRPQVQGRGLGRRLLSWVMDDTGQRGALSLLLEVRPSNPGALKLYESMGFEQIGLRKNYYPSWNQSREDAMVMSVHLNQPASAG